MTDASTGDFRKEYKESSNIYDARSTDYHKTYHNFLLTLSSGAIILSFQLLEYKVELLYWIQLSWIALLTSLLSTLIRTLITAKQYQIKSDLALKNHEIIRLFEHIQACSDLVAKGAEQRLDFARSQQKSIDNIKEAGIDTPMIQTAIEEYNDLSKTSLNQEKLLKLEIDNSNNKISKLIVSNDKIFNEINFHKNLGLRLTRLSSFFFFAGIFCMLCFAWSNIENIHSSSNYTGNTTKTASQSVNKIPISATSTPTPKHTK